MIMIGKQKLKHCWYLIKFHTLTTKSFLHTTHCSARAYSITSGIKHNTSPCLLQELSWSIIGTKRHRKLHALQAYLDYQLCINCSGTLLIAFVLQLEPINNLRMMGKSALIWWKTICKDKWIKKSSLQLSQINEESSVSGNNSTLR